MCVKCKHRVFFDPATMALYYMDDACNKLPLPAGTQIGGVPVNSGGGGAPNLPPVDPEMPPTSDLACFKANGLWAVVNQAMTAMLDVQDAGLGLVYTSLQSQHPEVDWDNYKLFSFALAHGGSYDWEELEEHWNEYGDSVKEAFLCSLQYRFEKTQQLSAAELTMFKAYDFDSPSVRLDDFLTEMIKTVEDKAYQEAAAYYVTAQTGACDCLGGEVPPAVPDGFGVITGELVQFHHRSAAPENFNTPAEYLASTGTGLKVNEQTYETANPGDGSKVLGCIFYVPAGVRFTNFRFTRTYSGTLGGGRTLESSIYTNDNELDAWEVVFEPVGGSPVDLTPVVVSDTPGISPARYLVICAILFNCTGADKLTYSNIRFDIAAADGSWTRTNVAPGVPFQL